MVSAIRDYLFPINPVTGRREAHLIPTSLEKFVGACSYAPLIERSGGEITGQHSNDDYRIYYEMVQETGKQLAKHAKRKDITYEFTVLDNGKDNAWCLPGGKIGINVGLIKRMENESGPFSLKEKIAAVLSHEIIHADARHTGRALEFRLFLIGIIKAAQLFTLHVLVHRSYKPKIEKEKDPILLRQLKQERDNKVKTISAIFDLASSWLIQGISLCNSRTHEFESDRFGMRLIRDAAKAGEIEFNINSPQAAIWLQIYFEKKHKPGLSFLKPIKKLFSTHPTSVERRIANEKTWADLQAGNV